MNAHEINIWWLFGFALLGRLLDIFSTWLASPTLKLEGNGFIRRFGWPYALLTILAAFLTFVQPGFGVIIGTVSYILAFSNMRSAMMVRYAGGEDALLDLIRKNASFKLSRSLIDTFVLPLPMLMLAAPLFATYGISSNGIGTYIADGIIVYVFVITFHKLFQLLRYYWRRYSQRMSLRNSSKPSVSK
ncbi:hypothetical protein [Metallibacterium sp.]|uniref:hypothetical protein n=1 Tax=Metallibacterium sp. TaxID=2940281 RepID=UPI0026111242|nr:hypothetical protein [Metallibacterium sp.]